MADVIHFADWAELQTLIEEGNTAVSGMSAAEAQAALGATANNGLYVYNAATGAGANNVIQFPNTTAAEAAEAYLESGGTTSAAGAATASTGAAQETANLTLVKNTATGATGVAGLLSMPISTAAAAISAPLAGITLGATLYSLNPTWWEKLGRTILPFAYSGTSLVPVVCDGQYTYYSSELIEAIQRFIASEGISGQTKGTATDGKDTVSFGGSPLKVNYPAIVSGYEYAVQYVEGSQTIFYGRDSEVTILYTETGVTQQFPLRASYTTPSGNKIYYGVADLGGSSLPVVSRTLTLLDIAKILYEGEQTLIYPEGTNPSTVEYPDGVTPLQVLTGYDEEGNPIYTPYYPVTTPIGDPGTSTDPNEDPTTNPDPEPAIEPYITPSPDPVTYPETEPVSDPAPLPNPVPDPQPVPDPDAEPEKDPDPDDTPDDPTDPTDPTDNGAGDTPIVPVIPTLPSAATGLLHVYNPTQSQIDAFGSWLWTTFSGDLIETLSKLFNSPMDAVIGLHELYATPAVSGSATIRCGYLDSGVGANLVGSRYTTINCGSVVVEEYYQNYLDYTPYTQCYIYLPFIGIVPVSADDIIGNAVNITYHIDSYTGCVIAVVTVAKKGYSAAVYQFEGNCAVEIPISSGYQSTLMSGLLAVAGTAITENPAVGMTAAHIGRAGLGKNAVQHSGSFGASYGAMGAKIPYIVVRRPTQKKVINYSESYGYPAHKMVFVGNCEGYLRCREVRVTSTTATNIEKEMIVNALKSGVYVK